MRALLKKLEAAFSGSVEIRAFGRSEGLIVDITSEKMLEVSAWLRMEETFRLDFLEALTAHETKGKIVLTAFLRSMPIGHSLMVRSAFTLPTATERLEVPSLSRIWPQSEAFETELAPLFGLNFLAPGKPSGVRKEFGDFGGFPLRKYFSWGQEIEP